MSNGSPIAALLLLTAISIILLVIGLLLHRKGTLRSRGASLVWAIITIVPVFVGGWIFLSQPASMPGDGAALSSGVNPT